MGLGYRSRFRPLALQRLVSTPTVAKPLGVRCPLFSVSRDAICVCLVAWCGVGTRTHGEISQDRARDRQTQNHKRKQGLLGLPAGKSRHLRSGLNILHPSTSTKAAGGGGRSEGKLIRRSARGCARGHSDEGRLLSR